MKRLQKVISEAGIASRRKAEDLIVDGKVSVNGKIIKELGYKVSGSDIVSVDGKEIKREDKVYFLLNKPRGVVSTTNDEVDRETVVDLIDTDKKVFPVGRLDYDTTGVILLTNDGDFANIITHPSYGLKKTYIAKINGILNKEEINFINNKVKKME